MSSYKRDVEEFEDNKKSVSNKKKEMLKQYNSKSYYNNLIKDTANLSRQISMYKNIFSDYSDKFTCKISNEDLMTIADLYVDQIKVKISEIEHTINIDEAQELKKREFELLQRVDVDNGTLWNIYGDLNQSTGNNTISSWNEVLNDFKEFELNVNYRNPMSIVEFTNNECNLNMVSINSKNTNIGILESLEKIMTETDNLEWNFIMSENLEINIVNLLQEKFAEFNNVSFSRINEVKGLEFKRVCVIRNKMTRNELVVAYTRSIDELYVLDL